jgi:hypothetical protein
VVVAVTYAQTLVGFRMYFSIDILASGESKGIDHGELGPECGSVDKRPIKMSRSHPEHVAGEEVFIYKKGKA